MNSIENLNKSDWIVPKSTGNAHPSLEDQDVIRSTESKLRKPMDDLSSGKMNSNWNQSGLLTQNAVLLPAKTVIANIKVVQLLREEDRKGLEINMT